MPSTEGKIKAKDLSYESTLPPFLQRLHAQNAGRGDQDRHERPVARPQRVKTNDEDDGPTVVDESGETVSKDELEKMTTTDTAVGEDANVKGTEKGDGEPKASGAIQDDEDVQRADQKVTNGTATKKRKMAKVVGDEEGDGLQEPEGSARESKKAVKKVKKKAKPIKLAFDEDEET